MNGAYMMTQKVSTLVHVECSGHTFSGMTVPHRTPSGLPHPARSAPLGAPQRAQQEGKLRCGLGRAALAAKVPAVRRRVEQHRAARARGQPPQPRGELGGAPGGHARVVRGGGDQRGRVGGAARGAQRVVRAERGQGGTVGGSPSSSRSCAVSGSPPSSIAVSTSTNGACPETQRKMTSMTLTLPYTHPSQPRAPAAATAPQQNQSHAGPTRATAAGSARGARLQHGRAVALRPPHERGARGQPARAGAAQHDAPRGRQAGRRQPVRACLQVAYRRGLRAPHGRLVPGAAALAAAAHVRPRQGPPARLRAPDRRCSARQP